MKSENQVKTKKKEEAPYFFLIICPVSFFWLEGCRKTNPFSNGKRKYPLLILLMFYIYSLYSMVLGVVMIKNEFLRAIVVSIFFLKENPRLMYPGPFFEVHPELSNSWSIEVALGFTDLLRKRSQHASISDVA